MPRTSLVVLALLALVMPAVARGDGGGDRDRVHAGARATTWGAASRPSGSYLVRLDAGGRVETARVTVVK